MSLVYDSFDLFAPLKDRFSVRLYLQLVYKPLFQSVGVVPGRSKVLGWTGNIPGLTPRSLLSFHLKVKSDLFAVAETSLYLTSSLTHSPPSVRPSVRPSNTCSIPCLLDLHFNATSKTSCFPPVGCPCGAFS